jgi:hypothetical protein
MADRDEDRSKSRRPDEENRGWSTTGQVLSGRMIEGLNDIVCGLHRAQGDEECGCLVWRQNQGRRFLPV